MKMSGVKISALSSLTICPCFRMAFPTLFPDGKGDITCSRPGKKVSLHKWLKHLLRTDRRFANDPLFVMVATNIIQKQEALNLGRLYANKKASELTTEELKTMLEDGNDSVLPLRRKGGARGGSDQGQCRHR